MAKKKSSKRKKISKDNFKLLKENIIGLLRTEGHEISLRQVIKKLGIRDKKNKEAVRDVIKNLDRTTLKGKNSLSANQMVIGRVDYVNPRFAFIISDETDKDILVKHENLLNAFDDDLVKVKVLPSRRKSDRKEGKVVEVLERKRDEFVGRIEMNDKFAFVVPDFRKMYHDIFVPLSRVGGAKQDDKVIVKIEQWPSNTKSPEGKVLRVLGKSGENEAEIHSIIAEFEIPYEFPENVLRHAENIPGDIPADEIANRHDIRGVTTFTIDPEDAKDFDDAISYRELDNGNFEVGVHIADVSYYVEEGTVLDKEALYRATSVYLVDRTIPMLPERLSNELCSLRPHEDKLTYSAIFELDSEARIIKEWFGKTIINSDRRFTYEEAQERLETLQGDFVQEIVQVNKLAVKLKDERFKRGSINFETDEIKFKLDEKGKPLGVYRKVRKDAHKLIEEFMLLANKRVAEYVFNMKKRGGEKTFVYRTHDYPDPEKLNSFSLFAKKFGYELRLEGDKLAASFNRLIDNIEGMPEQHVLQSMAIRSMAKAKYTTAAEQHFGLAFPHYTHFTSPIRRYPDIMAHRLLLCYMNGGRSVKEEKYEKMCKHSSENEKRAADAERASVKYKQVEFIQDKVGEEFDGIVSGVTEWGVYVEMTEAKCEGMVRMSDLTGDFFHYDQDNYRLLGERTGRSITLGDKMRVKVVRADINRRIIDLDLVAYDQGEKKGLSSN